MSTVDQDAIVNVYFNDDKETPRLIIAHLDDQGFVTYEFNIASDELLERN